MIRNGICNRGVTIQGNDTQIKNRRCARANINRMPQIATGLSERPVFPVEHLNNSKWHHNQANEEISTRQRGHVVVGS